MSNKILELTTANRDMIQVVHQMFYDMALETETNEVNIKNAEEAASKLVGSALKPGYKIGWLSDPRKCETYYQEKLYRLFGQWSLTESMYESSTRGFRVAAVDHVREGRKTMFCDLVYQRVSKECYNEGYNIHVDLMKELIGVRALNKLGASAVFSLTNDLPWAAECSYWARTLPDGCGVDLGLWVTAVHDFFEAAHAFWVLPDEVIICKKPDGVTTDATGNIISMQWGPIERSVAENPIFCEDPQPGDVRVYNQ